MLIFYFQNAQSNHGSHQRQLLCHREKTANVRFISSLTCNQTKGTSNRIESELLDERKAAYIVACAQTFGPIASEKVRIEKEIEVPEELEDSVYCHKKVPDQNITIDLLAILKRI